MIFFSGLGILVAPIIIIGFGIPVMIEQWVLSHYGYKLPNVFFLILVTIIPFVGIKILDSILKKRGPIERIKDQHGNIVEIPANHSFMFLPLGWCANVWLIFIGILTIWIYFNPPPAA